MSAPKWGLFMSKVYSDKKLNYGKVLEFEQPAELKNDPIYADINFANIANSGDSLDENTGNGGAVDFLGEEADGMNDFSDEKQPKKSPADSGNKPKQSPSAIKPGDDKKAPVKPKPKSGSEY